MTAILQFIAVTALGLAVAWGVSGYYGLVGKNWTTALAGFAALLTVGFIYDRWQAKKRRDTPGS